MKPTRTAIAVTMLVVGVTGTGFADDNCSKGNALACYTEALERLQSAQDALAAARNDIKSLRAEIEIAAPVGSVVPMFLAPEQIAELAPAWLPADGRKVADPSSPLNGETLPDLRDRVVLGTNSSPSVIPDNSENLNGTLEASIPFSASGTTSNANLNSYQQRVQKNDPPRFVVDTSVDEILSADHNHTVTVNGTLKVNLPRQPYRRLVYMVHCRSE